LWPAHTIEQEQYRDDITIDLERTYRQIATERSACAPQLIRRIISLLRIGLYARG